MLDFIKSYLTSFVMSIVVMGIIYSIIWIFFGERLKNRKIQLSKRAGSIQIKDEIIAAAYSLLGSTIFQVLVFSLRDKGLTKLYVGIEPYGLPYLVFTVVFILLVSDAWFYWLHRSMHHPSVYKYVHALHHRSLDVNPFTSNSFHVLEALGLTLWVLPLVLIMPVSATAFGIVQALGTLNNLKSHLGYEFFPNFFNKAPFNVLVTATNHSLHHTQYNGNYGLYFRFWDQWCNTELNMTDSLFNQIHNRQNEKIIDNTKYKKLTIHALEKETDNTVSVYFKPTDALFYEYSAGQYLTVRVKIGTKTYDRCFSLSSAPGLDPFLRITVKLKGEVSNYFYHQAQPGHTIEALYPVGDFGLPSVEPENYVFVAGGSGITPFMSIIRSLYAQNNVAKVTLLYANKTEQNVIFKDYFMELAQSNPNFSFKTFYSGKSRISPADLALPKAEYFICGPDSLKNGIVANLRKANINNSSIHVENYADGYVPWFGLF
jgi:ring-1,2-phenylacetyl-CoA epoxidase subunit PaaE